MGALEDWNTATDALRAAITELGYDYEVNEGDGAFYGPKLDFHLTDCLGRTWQCGTIQLDFQLPERFELEYTGADGAKHRPIMIHRVVFGSIERFIGILTEHFAGAFPMWLAPVQVKILPIAERHHDYAAQLEKALTSAGLRVENDLRSEKIGYKIFATKGTAEALTEAGVKAIAVNKIEQSTPNLMDLILGHKIDLVIDTPPQGAEHSKDGFVIRRSAIETGVNVLTAIDTAKALITSLENTDIQKLTLVDIAKIQAV